MGVLFYRLYRLRRLIVVAMLLPLAVVGLIALFKGGAAMALIPFAVLVPLAHILRYPTSWMETIAVSLTLSCLLALAGFIGPDVGVVGLAFRILGLAALGFILFMVFVNVVSGFTGLGAERPMTIRTSRRSSLDAATLKERITLYPGRTDDKVICGEAGEDGVFEVTYKHQMPGIAEFVPNFEIEMTDEELAEVGMTRAELDEMNESQASGNFDVVFKAIVVTSSADSHEVIAIQPETEETTATRYIFEAKKRGTVVTMEERAPPLAGGMRFGFWLQDYMADYLTDEIDRAEGRPQRANRFVEQGQLIVDIARWFMPRMAGMDGSE